MGFGASGGAGGGLWELIEEYEALIAEASHVFTISPEITFDDDSMLVMVLDGGVTLQLALQMVINANVTSNYFDTGRRIATVGAHTYEVRSFSSSANQIALGISAIMTQVITG